RTKKYLQKLLALYKEKENIKFNKYNYINNDVFWYVKYNLFIYCLFAIFNSMPEVEFNNSNLKKQIIVDYNLIDANLLFYNDTYIIMNLQNENCEWQKGIFKNDLFFPKGTN